MSADSEILQLELLSRHLYQSSDLVQRAAAENATVNFQNSPDALVKCQLLLDRGSSSFAQLLATTTLTKLVSRPAHVISLQQQIQIKNYILSYLGARTNLETFVVQALALLYAKITKHGWFAEDNDVHVFQNVIGDIGTFLHGSVEQCTTGIRLLSTLTSEINQITEMEENRSLHRKHRKIASSFRDQKLFEIFKLCCTLLKTTLDNRHSVDFSQNSSQHDLVSQSLQLAHNCLNFDFMGTSKDDSTENDSDIQIPKSWRPAFLDFGALQVFFDFYQILPASLSHVAMSCLVQMAAVRRSLFSNAERVKFLTQLISGVKNVLKYPLQSGLSEINNYHEFCRLLARLRINFTLSELISVEIYPEVIQLIAKFTVDSIRQMLQVAPNSVHFLLTLWQRLVTSELYDPEPESHKLESFTPEIIRAYLAIRLDSSPGKCNENALDDLESLAHQLEQIAAVGRCNYESTCTLIAQLFDQSAQSYQTLLQQPSLVRLDTVESKFAWQVHIIGALIGDRFYYSSRDDHEKMDGELTCRVLQLMQLTDSRLSQGSCERLELAYLSFLEYFRKSYIGDNALRLCKVYCRLSEVLHMPDESAVLSAFLRKVLTNLKYWSSSELVLLKTLDLLGGLTQRPHTVRKLLKLDEVQFLLSKHGDEHFPFLAVNLNVKNLRCRTTFYSALTRILMLELGEDEELFTSFVRPLTARMETVRQLFASSATDVFKAEEAKQRIIGLARDLRGIILAFITKTTYVMFFDWIYPSYTPFFLRAVEIWFQDPALTTSVLKLFTELFQNRSQRVHFGISSPNGILLFREASKMMCAFGNRILTVDVPQCQLYAMKWKGVSLCFNMLRAALCGRYTNFGVFQLYGDNALNNALNCCVKLSISIPPSDLKDYPKLSLAYYSLLEVVAQDHVKFLVSLEPNVFLYILSTISDGLSAFDSTVSTGCCVTLDYIASYIFKQLTRKDQPDQGSENLLQTLEKQPDIFQKLLKTTLDIVMFDDCRNQWSMSRPLFVLILLNEAYFVQLQETIVRSQLPDMQADLACSFENLMEGVQKNLLLKNREKFSQNLSKFQKEISESFHGYN